VPFLHVTTLIEGRKDDDLLTRKTGRAGWPAILILDANGEMLMKLDRPTLSAAITGDRTSAAFFEPKVHACERYVALRAKVAEGDKAAEVCLAMRGLEIGRIDLAEFGRALAGIELTPERAQKVARLRANAICETRVAETRAAGMDPEAEKAATREFLKLYEAGTHPDSDSADVYWYFIGVHAKTVGDRAMAARSIEGLEATGGGRFGQLIAELKALPR
jgi:hypothetical protein